MSDLPEAPGSPLSSAPYRVYLAGQAVSRLGDGVVSVTFAFAALAVAPDGRGIPMVLLALWISRFVLVAHGGSLPDRIGRLPVMIGADAVRLAAQVFPAVSFALGHAELWHLVASAAVYGAAAAFFTPGAVGLLPDLVHPAQLQKANSWLDVAGDTGRLAGPALASLLVVAGGVPLALFFDAATFVVSLISLAWLRRLLPAGGDARPAEDPAGDDPEEPVRFLDAVRIMPRLPLVLGAVLVWLPVQIGLASVSVLGPVIAQDRLGGIEQWGVIVTFLAAGGLVGALVSGHVRGERRGLLTIALLVISMPAQLLALAYGPSVPVVAGALFLAGLAAGVAGVVFDTLVQLTVPKAMLSRVGSFETTMTTAMVPLGFVIALPLATLVGRTAYLAGLAVVVVATAGAVLAWAVPRTGLRDPYLERGRS
ncbi:enterobactin exporter EntS [Nonomuraea coxensis DSM 45129]|uniref:Enterobactin exporter EntS n=1 Tax=Nonomuraea coxensis DSM 45129 TaxID=1122611 RepID=A0ABX8TUJ2_9ACTN|nr:MFS transporter [Nonomuraea coxensis]QYC39033.1 enterobactin exporter EntS [Nonomuraea coxensis DSM 45129]